MTRSSLRLQEKKQALLQANTQRSGIETGGNLEPTASSARGSNKKRVRDESFNEERDTKKAKTSKSDRKLATGKKGKGSVAIEEKADVKSKVIAKSEVRNPSTGKKVEKIKEDDGALETLLTDLPNEMLFEVFCHVNPLDLLHLARACKNFRDILMSKRSVWIWRAARSNVKDLPPLPEDLSEPRYAHLMFGTHCDNCIRDCMDVVWEYHMRCCGECEEEIFFPPHKLTKSNKGKASFDKIRNLIPSHWVSRIGTVFLPSVVEKYVAEYEATESDPEKRAQWIEERKRYQEALREHAALCDEWLEPRLPERINEIAAVRAKRLYDILSKLDEIGWADEARMMIAQSSDCSTLDDFSGHPLVHQTEELTNQGWEIIEQPLVQFLQQQKRRRVLISRCARVERMYEAFRKQANRPQEVHPTLGDIFASKLFDHIIKKTPLDQKVMRKSLARIFTGSVPTFVAEWRAAREDELLNILRRSVPTATDKSALRLATSIFQYRDDSHSYYDAIDDRYYCAADLPTYIYDAIDDKDLRVADNGDTATLPCTKSYGNPWNHEHVQYFSQASAMVRKVIEGCGLDPLTVTFDDLSALDPLIECHTCEDSEELHDYSDSTRFFRWIGVLGHINHEISVLDSELKRTILTARHFDVPWCPKCDEEIQQPVVPHLEECHGIIIWD